MEPTMFVPASSASSPLPSDLVVPPPAIDPEDETMVSPPAAFSFNTNPSNLPLLPSEKAVETLFAALSPLRQYTPYFYGVFDAPLRPNFSLGDLEAPLLSINRRYHQSNRRSLGQPGVKPSPQILAAQQKIPVTPFTAPDFNQVSPDIKKGLLEIVSEFESLEEEDESETEQYHSSSTDESGADADGGSPSFGSALLGSSTNFASQPRSGLGSSSPNQSSNVVRQLMSSAAEIPNPVPQNRSAQRTAAAPSAPVTSSAKNALTQRLIDMVKKTASQQGVAPGAGATALSADQQIALDDQGRVSSRGRKRKAKATSSLVDGDDDQLSYEQDDDLINVQPSGAIVVRHHYIPVQSDGTATGVKAPGGANSGSPKITTAVLPRNNSEDPRFVDEADDDTEDDEDDDYDFVEVSQPMLNSRAVPRVAPAAGVVPPGSSPTLNAHRPGAMTPQSHMAAPSHVPNGKRGAPIPVTLARTGAPAANNGKASPQPPNQPTKIAGSARKTVGGRPNSHSHTHHHSTHPHASHLASQLDDSIWNVEETEERKRVKEFWLSLTPDARAGLIKLEKDAVLRKMKEQQKHTCTCSVCGRRRTAIEEELEMLYDAYYDELERYTERQTEPGGFSFFKNLGAKGGMLSVANDLMKNEGKKFLEMMERLADRRMKQSPSSASPDGQQHPGSSASTDASEESYDDDIPQQMVEPATTVASAHIAAHHHGSEEQRLEEGKRMFQMFAAKMFEQRILAAYREKVALEKQQKLIEEEEERERLAAQKRDQQKKKREAKKAKRKQKAEEEAKAEREKKEREEREKEEKARIEREKKELAKKLKAEEEEKKRQQQLAEEEERRKRERERREAEEKERKKKEKAELEKKEKEQRERAAREAAAKEAAALQAAREAAAAAAAKAAAEAAEDQYSGEADEDEDTDASADPSAAAGSAKKRKKRQRNKNKKTASVDKSDVYIPGMVKPGTIQNTTTVPTPAAPAPAPAPVAAPVAAAEKSGQIQLKKRPQESEQTIVVQDGPRPHRKWRERQQQQQQQQQQQNEKQPSQAPVQILEKPQRGALNQAQVRAATPNPNAPVFTPPTRPKMPTNQPNSAAPSFVPPSYSAYAPPAVPAASTAAASAQYYPSGRTTEPQTAPRRSQPPAQSSSNVGNIDLLSVANLLPSTLLPALEGSSQPSQERVTSAGQNAIWSNSVPVGVPTTPGASRPNSESRLNLSASLDDADDPQLRATAKSVLSSILDPDDEIVAPVRRTGPSVLSPKVNTATKPGSSNDNGWSTPLSHPGAPSLGPIGGSTLDPFSSTIMGGLGKPIGPPGVGLKSMFIDTDLTSFYRGAVVDPSIWSAGPAPTQPEMSPRHLAPGSPFGQIGSSAPGAGPIGKPFSGK